ncbi:MAG: hypothetical protein L6R38_008174 [Xanthoria sp. 2 TBL-2021]|nr:MAG: hypothetical protein L6R38_008174 [Xanthoria sp. 2 TBL-2021]
MIMKNDVALSGLATHSDQVASNGLNETCPASKVPPTPNVPYTVFTHKQKRRFRLLLGFATITSPLTATCYFPLLPLLRTHFETSAQAINLTLTIYIIFQALSPAVFGPLSDSIGRRLVFLVTLTLYAFGNLGLALNKSSYAALLVLRALQSLGASAALAISYGVVADICVPSERGRMLGSEGNAKAINQEGQNTGDSPVSSRSSILQQCRFVNPLACLRVMFHLDTFFALWMQGSFYVVDYAIVAVMPDLYKDIYNFNELQVGLTYIPRGVGIITASFCIGKMMDYNYKTVARKIGWNIDEVAGDDLQHFPIERARARGSYYLLIISTAVLVGYGWAVTKHAHLAIVLILQFIQGSMGTCFYNTYNALLVDVFPESPSTAAAAASIVRCAMAAAGIAILQPLLAALGRGWYLTILGIWSGGCGALAVLVIERKGMSWRTRRTKRKNERSRANING